ncbi:hypothetical protein KKG46_03175 [Patescibacteria group bacterium]|nr:hypothetical protein [Patescibacteria group bacterium]
MFKKIIVFLTVGVFVLSASPAFATAHFEAGDYVDIKNSNDDTYVAGQNVSATGDVDGDLFAAGQIVRCSSNVSQDVNLAGSVVDLFCNVGDDARLAGSIITIGGIVEDDVFAFGAMVRVLPGAIIKGDLITGAGSVVIDGQVLGNVLGGAGQMMVQGQVLGSVIVEADDLQVGNSANIGGILQYTSNNEAKIDESAVIAAGIDHKMPEVPRVEKRERKNKDISAGALFGLWFLVLIIKILVSLVTVLLALYFFKKHILAMSKSMLLEFPKHMGWGFVWTLIVPLASFILILTIFGSVLGAFGFVVYLLVVMIAKMLAMVGLGSWLWKVFSKAKTYEMDWKIATLGIVVMCIVSSIPVLGWIFAIVFMLAAVGSVVSYLRQAIK